MPALDRLLRRVRRRLFLQALVRGMLPCLAAALVAVAVWFVIQPIFWAAASAGWKWGVAGSLVGTGLGVALILAYRRFPSPLAAALALDEKFNLRERVTTLLTLPTGQLESSAGQALYADVERRIASLKLAGTFPLRMSWSGFMVPVCAAVLAVTAFFLQPFWPNAAGSPNPIPAATAKEIKNQFDNLKKVPLRPFENRLPKSEELKELDNAWDKLVKQPPPKTEEQLRERIKEMRDLQDKMKDRMHNLRKLAAKTKNLKSLMQKLNPDAKKSATKEMKDLEDALAKGKLDKAGDALERLAKKLADKKLTKEEQHKLAQELKDLQEKLERLAEQTGQKDKLQRDFDEGKISKEELEREMDRLAKAAENLKDLQELADLLGQCRSCLGQGGAAGMLRRLQGKLKTMQLSEEELRDLLENQDRLDEACDTLLVALNQCHGNCDGDGLMNGLGQGKRPGGRRPVGAEPNSKVVNARQKADVDPKAQQHVTGFTKGGVFSRIPARAVGGAFKQAVQDAPEAIDRQNIPPDASDMAKGYFKNLSGQK